MVQPLNDQHGPRIGGIDPEQLFVVKLTAAGGALDFSTFLLGGGDVNALALTDQSGVVITGQTSGGLTTTADAWQRMGAGGFVLELNPSLTAVAYSTHLGGTPADLALDANGNFVIIGTAPPGSLRTTHAGFASDNSFNSGSEVLP